MARPIRLTLSSATASNPIPLDTHQNGFSVSVALKFATDATLTCTVEHTFDDPFAADFNPATAVWYPHETLTDVIANEAGNYAYPVTAIRLNVTAYTDGSVTMTVIQSGIWS